MPGFSRQRRRFQVALPVRIGPRRGMRHPSRSASRPLMVENALTENVSTAGCYFHLSREVSIGSRVEMEIVMPTSRTIPRILKVRCRGKVVRVDHDLPDRGVGVACTIERYRLLPTSAAPGSS